MVSIPLSALAEKDGQSIVWTVDRRRDTVHARPVKVADFTADGVRVAEGLKPGDVVVAAGTQFMTENLKVKLAGDAVQQSASADRRRRQAGALTQQRNRLVIASARAARSSGSGFRAACARWTRRSGRCNPHIDSRVPPR